MERRSEESGGPLPGSESPTAEVRLGSFQYFRYLTLIIVVAFTGLAVEHAVLGLDWLLLVDTSGALGLLLVRHWVMAAGDATRLVIGANLVTTLCLAVLLGHAFATGQNRSLASWFLPVLPIIAAFLGGTRAAIAWVLIAIATTLVLWLSEYFIAIPPNLLTSPRARALARIALILIGAAFGITARRISERQTYALIVSLLAEQEAKRTAEKARRQAEAASHAKTDFLATVSHEIRTPLNGMIGLASLLQDMITGDTPRQYLAQVRASGEMLLHLVNDILDYARLEAGQLPLVESSFDPHTVAEETHALVAAQARAKGLTLSLEIEAPDEVRGDPQRLRQILLNFMVNAVKFTQHGDIHLSCHVLTRQGPRTWLRFEVRDHGMGIDEEAVPDLFQPFAQADASTTRVYGGTGLGLAICKTLTDLMGGDIGFHSVPGQGSTFWVELPFDAPLAGARVRSPAPEEAPPPPEGQLPSLRVLLAEDNSVNQFVASEMLRRLGCDVVVVSNGQLAVEAVRERHFDLVLMDCDMPLLDGFDATRAIRAGEPPGRHVPIVAMTAAVFEGDRERCLAAGMDDYLPKPVRLGDLSGCLEKWGKERSGR